MNTSDDVLGNLLTHKIVEGRVPEADPTRAHLELNIEPYVKGDDMDQLYDELIKETKKWVLSTSIVTTSTGMYCADI